MFLSIRFMLRKQRALNPVTLLGLPGLNPSSDSSPFRIRRMQRSNQHLCARLRCQRRQLRRRLEDIMSSNELWCAFQSLSFYQKRFQRFLSLVQIAGILPQPDRRYSTPEKKREKKIDNALPVISRHNVRPTVLRTCLCPISLYLNLVH